MAGEGPSLNQLAGTIPSPAPQQQAPSNGGFQQADLSKLFEPPHSAAEMSALALGASIPTSSAHSAQVPDSLQYQPKQAQFGQGNHNPPPPGKGNARAQGIGNAIIGVTNAITGFATAESNKKKLQLATDTHTLLNSQQAVDQAKQVLENDPQNKTAIETIKHNQDIMNGILSDKKTRDAIAKGFKIDFTDPQANNTPDHQGVNQGKEMAKKTEQLSMADQFAKGVPQQMQQNPMTAAKYQSAMLENKAAAETTKALGPILSAQIRAGAQVDAATIRAQGEAFKAAYTSQARTAQEAQKFLNAEKLQGLKFGYESKLAVQKAGLAFANAKGIMDMKDSDPTTIMSKSVTALSNIQRSTAQLHSQITSLETSLSAEKDESRKSELRAELLHLKGLVTYNDEAYQDTKTFFDSLKLKGGSNGAAAATSADTDTEDTDDINDPNHYLNADN